MIFFDRNLPRSLSTFLVEAGQRATHLDELIERGDLPSPCPDEAWIRHCGMKRWAAITGDIKVSRTASLKAECGAHRVPLILVPGSIRKRGAWEMSKVIVARWDDLVQALEGVDTFMVFELRVRGRIRST